MIYLAMWWKDKNVNVSRPCSLEHAFMLKRRYVDTFKDEGWSFLITQFKPVFTHDLKNELTEVLGYEED